MAERTADLESPTGTWRRSPTRCRTTARAARAMSGFSEALLDDYGGRLDETGRGYAERTCPAASDGELIDDLSLPALARRDAPRDGGSERRGRPHRRELEQSEPERHAASHQDSVKASADPILIQRCSRTCWGTPGSSPASVTTARIEFGRSTRRRRRDLLFVRDNGAGFDMAYVEQAVPAVPAPARGSASSRAPASDSPPCSASSSATAAASGPKAPSARARRSTSPSTQRTAMRDRIHPARRGQSRRRGAHPPSAREEQHPQRDPRRARRRRGARLPLRGRQRRPTLLPALVLLDLKLPEGRRPRGAAAHPRRRAHPARPGRHPDLVRPRRTTFRRLRPAPTPTSASRSSSPSSPKPSTPSGMFWLLLNEPPPAVITLRSTTDATPVPAPAE